MERLTERLRLRMWRDDDLDPLAAMDGDPEVMRYIGDGVPRTREQTAEALVRRGLGWQERGFGLFAVEVRETGDFAGWVGLAVPEFLPEVLPAVEIGWRLGRAHWGRGYATEAAREVLAFGFREVGLEEIVSVARVDNEASLRVMAKLGMRPERRTTVPSTGRPVQVTVITREEYVATPGAASSTP
ncbi:GNAT family N-acetyltransferase [Microtetraspora malaysiensis]|uniref:GNAT family N-acetyltransferase n=1 Tax=Microtetraspora malaysiensis TaxID=161358 RepID=UPI000B2ED505|nr:GNAT family N-acetyltransferase [Microtetraspora malaysiensis]